MPTLAISGAERAYDYIRIRNQAVNQRGFTHPRLTNQHAYASSKGGFERVDTGSGLSRSGINRIAQALIFTQFGRQGVCDVCFVPVDQGICPKDFCCAQVAVSKKKIGCGQRCQNNYDLRKIGGY